MLQIRECKGAKKLKRDQKKLNVGRANMNTGSFNGLFQRLTGVLSSRA